MATRLAGSSDLYQASGRRPYHSINFITSHDGFTLNDLVSYNHKHNEANGEENRDGDNNNYSYNYGVEGPDHPARRSSASASGRSRTCWRRCCLSQGVPMLLFGDECRRTQQGNNNAYCQDNAISWFDWRLVGRTKRLLRFCQALVEFRKAEPTVRRTDFLTGLPSRPGGLPDVSWHRPDGKPWTGRTATAAWCAFRGGPAGATWPTPPNHHVLIMFHAGAEPHKFVDSEDRPKLSTGGSSSTRRRASPHDIYPDLQGPSPPAKGVVELVGRSLMCFVAPDEI